MTSTSPAGTLVSTLRDSSGKHRHTNGFSSVHMGWANIDAGDVGIVVHEPATLISGDDPGDAILVMWSSAGLLLCPRSAICVVLK